MTDTTLNHNFPLTSLNQAYLIQMPLQFTTVEANSFKKFFQQICQTYTTVKKIILDFGQTTFIDSSGLVGLSQIAKLIKNTNFELTFWSFSPQVKTVVSSAGLEQVLATEEVTEIFVNSDSDRVTQIHPAVLSQKKRLLDICGSVVGLGITALLFIPLAIAIKLDSPGPILFKQIRCGYRGKLFQIWKFRSMVSNAEELKEQVENKVQGPLFKNKNDPRVTKIGRFLRKTSLDEFPQFWNILQGDMSLVGTRPPTFQEVESYKIDYGQRLDVKPGLTGEWQVSGRSTIEDFNEVLRLDLQYQQNWNLLYDLKLIFKTIGVIFSKKSGAC